MFLTATLCAGVPESVGASQLDLDRDRAIRLIESAEDNMTLAEVRERCAVPGRLETAGLQDQKGPVERGPEADRKAVQSPFSIKAHKPNYFLAAAYTNQSFWQMYKSEQSEPFRETNHEPEIWLHAYLPSIEQRWVTMSDLHTAIRRKFKDAGIVIAFPQRDVHLTASEPLEIRAQPAS